jgi:hypothetical protein
LWWGSTIKQGIRTCYLCGNAAVRWSTRGSFLFS